MVGSSDLKGDTANHAFLWQNDAITDLGTPSGDLLSAALGINDRGEIVGTSIDAKSSPRAVLSENGVPFDLNTLATNASGLHLQLAESINAQGEIVGYRQTSTGEAHGFWRRQRRAL